MNITYRISDIPSSQVDHICKIHTMHIFQKNKLDTSQINLSIPSLENPNWNTLQYTIYCKYGIHVIQWYGSNFEMISTE
jgi:hypothetical protein